MTDPIANLRAELAYARDRLSRARAAYRRDPLDARAMRWVDDAEEMVELWLRCLERAEAEAIRAGARGLADCVFHRGGATLHERGGAF